MNFLKFQRLMGFNGYRDAASNEGTKAGGAGNGGSSDADASTAGEDKQAGDGDTPSGGDDDDDDESAKSKSNKPSDREAELLKESMRRKEHNKVLESELKDVKSKLKQFDGINLEHITALLSDAAKVETKKLEDKGAWDKLKVQMSEQHNVETDKLKMQLKQTGDKLTSVLKTVDKLTIGHSFDSSRYIAETLALTPNKARIIFGDHFDIVEGDVVAFDKPRGINDRMQLINGNGNPLGFNDAIKKIVESDSDRDTLIRSKVKTGSDSKPGTGQSKPKVETLRGMGKIADALNKASK